MNIFGLSDVGLARENNEDTCLYELRDEGAQAIFVVRDGMGRRAPETLRAISPRTSLWSSLSGRSVPV